MLVLVISCFDFETLNRRVESVFIQYLFAKGWYICVVIQRCILYNSLLHQLYERQGLNENKKKTNKKRFLDVYQKMFIRCNEFLYRSTNICLSKVG